MDEPESNVTPFRTCKQLWMAWMQNEKQELEDPYLIDLHKKIMDREYSRNQKKVPFYYHLEYECFEKKETKKTKEQLIHIIKILIQDIDKTSIPYGFRTTKVRIEHTAKKGINHIYIGLENLLFLKDLVALLLGDENLYQQVAPIKVISLKKLHKWPESN